jgi:hypothetical protein
MLLESGWGRRRPHRVGNGSTGSGQTIFLGLSDRHPRVRVTVTQHMGTQHYDFCLYPFGMMRYDIYTPITCIDNMRHGT